MKAAIDRPKTADCVLMIRSPLLDSKQLAAASNLHALTDRRTTRELLARELLTDERDVLRLGRVARREVAHPLLDRVAVQDAAGQHVHRAIRELHVAHLGWLGEWVLTL